jgi:hypothetical protein
MPRGWVWPPSAGMRAAGRQCLDDLTELGVKWKRARAVRKVATPIVVPGLQLGEVKLTPMFKKPPFVMDCQLARAIARQSHLFREAGIRELRFSSIHVYRRVRLNGGTRPALSRHALGLAIDVYELVTDSGERLVVASDYVRTHLFMDVEQKLRASGAFRALLTPGNDPQSHYDHFHFEAKMGLRAPRLRVAARRRPPRQARQARAGASAQPAGSGGRRASSR